MASDWVKTGSTNYSLPVMGTKSTGISGTAITVILVGGVLAYSGIKGKGIGATFRALLSGQSPDAVAQSNPISGGSADVSSPSVSTSTATPPAADMGGTPDANRLLGQFLAAAPPYGWVGAEWTALNNLFNRESGWDNNALNASSGAYGIAQALPSSKYPLAGQPESQGGSSSATVQISWGLSYIKSTYGDPVKAWAHETSNNWY